MSTDTDTASVEALADKLSSLRVVLGIDSPETRGWAPVVQQEARRTVTAGIVALRSLAAERDTLKAALEAEKRHPSILFDGFAVYQALSEHQRYRTSPENVADVLDAVVRIIRATTPKDHP